MEVKILMVDDHLVFVNEMPAEDVANLIDDFKNIECLVLTVRMGDPDSVIYINKDQVITIETSDGEPNDGE